MRHLGSPATQVVVPIPADPSSVPVFNIEGPSDMAPEVLRDLEAELDDGIHRFGFDSSAQRREMAVSWPRTCPVSHIVLQVGNRQNTPAAACVISSAWMISRTCAVSSSPAARHRRICIGFESKPRASCTSAMIASREKSECEVCNADSHKPVRVRASVSLPALFSDETLPSTHHCGPRARRTYSRASRDARSTA